MTDRSGCEETRQVLPELAAGVAPAEDRAKALRHLAVCRRCHRELEVQTALIDELLQLAPERQPPMRLRGLRTEAHAAPTAAPAPAQRDPPGRFDHSRRGAVRGSVRGRGLAPDRERPPDRRRLPQNARRRTRPVPARRSRGRGGHRGTGRVCVRLPGITLVGLRHDDCGTCGRVRTRSISPRARAARSNWVASPYGKAEERGVRPYRSPSTTSSSCGSTPLPAGTSSRDSAEGPGSGRLSRPCR